MNNQIIYFVISTNREWHVALNIIRIVLTNDMAIITQKETFGAGHNKPLLQADFCPSTSHFCTKSQRFKIQTYKHSTVIIQVVLAKIHGCEFRYHSEWEHQNGVSSVGTCNFDRYATLSRKWGNRQRSRLQWNTILNRTQRFDQDRNLWPWMILNAINDLG